MSSVLDRKKLEELAKELAKDVKSQDDLSDLSREFLKITVETALNSELDDHLGYPKHSPEGRGSGNSRHVHSPKTLKGDIGEVEIQNPRDRNGTFEPQLIRKGQTRLTKEGSKFWLSILTELQNRGAQDIFIAAVDGLSDFPEAIESVFPKTRVQFRIHTVRTDNGHEFHAKFYWHLADIGINHVYIKPRSPHLNGKVERSHSTDDQEFYQLLSYTDDVDLN